MYNVAIYLFSAIVFVGVGIPVSLGQQSKCLNSQSLPNSAVWNCVDKKKCKYADQIPAKNTVSCGARSICCPSPLPTIDYTNPTPAQIKEAKMVALNECYKHQGLRYQNRTDPGTLPDDLPEEVFEWDCKQDTQVLVANGDPVMEKEYPFMALLGYDEDVSDPTKWQCGGTIISSQYILTAAHCTKIEVKTLVKWALLGTLFRTNLTLDLRNKNLFRVVRRFNHPLYKAGKSVKENNDIALLKLEKEVKLSSSIRPICLYHDRTMANVNSEVQVAGWGVKVAGEQESENLQKAPISVLDASICVKQYGSDLTLENGFDKTTMICGGDLQRGRDSCPGDSGGPMLTAIANYTCMYLQVGVISRGAWSCGENTPAIYTRVSHFLPWIRSIAWSSTRT